MPFPYYRRLSRANQAIYRQSDALELEALVDPESFGRAIASLERALATENQRGVLQACGAIARELCRQLKVEPVAVKVLSSRPTDASEELHGLYETDEDLSHDRAVITVWMRTAARGEVVRFRTFLRTLLHEMCHHLDFWHFELGDSFHTEGFFRRESALMRQLAPKKLDSEHRADSAPDSKSEQTDPQLQLPW